MAENQEALAPVDEAPISEVVMRDALAIVDDREKLFQRIMQVSMAVTTNDDWCDQQGKPYMESSGAEKVARRFALRFYDKHMQRENHEDDRGHYYVYIMTGKVCFGKHPEEWLEVTGACSSRDNFFGRAHGKDKPIQDVDVCNIIKKAETNFHVRATTMFLGLRGLTWEFLSKYGISQKGKSKVNYKNKGQAASSMKAVEQAEKKSKKPFWTYDTDGKPYIFARPGKHFDLDFL